MEGVSDGAREDVRDGAREDDDSGVVVGESWWLWAAVVVFLGGGWLGVAEGRTVDVDDTEVEA
jgi:hypothetical protein